MKQFVITAAIAVAALAAQSKPVTFKFVDTSKVSLIIDTNICNVLMNTYEQTGQSLVDLRATLKTLTKQEADIIQNINNIQRAINFLNAYKAQLVADDRKKKQTPKKP